MDGTEFSVERVVLRTVSIPLCEPFRISNGSVSEKEAVIIELQSEGVTGYGEASPMSGGFYSSETPQSTWDALTSALVPDLLSRTVQSPVSYAGVLNEFRREPFARAGIEGAVWHLAASKMHTSIRELLGAPYGKIPSGLAVGIHDTIDELLARIAHFLEDGYRRTKIKIQPGWDIEPLRAIRHRFGPIPLMVDANAAYTLQEHREILTALDDFELLMIEQPLAATAIEDLAELRSTIETPICVDESADSLEMLDVIIARQAADIVNIKVQRVGGLWNARRMHDAAVRAGLTCWLGTMPELGIASAQSLALATLPGFVYPTDVEASDRWFVDDVITPKITVARKGYIVPPVEAGAMMYQIDQQKLDKYTTRTQTFER